MGKDSAIEWCDHTFNPWWGCVKVSEGCRHCYAETWSKRTGHGVWGPEVDRRFFTDSHWNKPRAWNRKAIEAGVRERVFCGSMCDVFEYQPEAGHGSRDRLGSERERLWALILDTPGLDWLLLTKRPENIEWMMPPELRGADHIWLGTSCEDQAAADERIPHLLRCPAAVRFVSCEPLLGPVDPFAYDGEHRGCCGICGQWKDRVRMRYRGAFIDAALCESCFPGLGWVIAGGESGPGARGCDIAWIRNIVRQCQSAAVPVFVKQLGADPYVSPAPIPAGGHSRYMWETGQEPDEDCIDLDLDDPKGADPSEWPEDLRVRQMPEVFG